MKPLALIAILLLSPCLQQVCFATDLSESFSARCHDVAMHDYDFHVGANEQVLTRGWSTDDKMLSGFNFRWSPPDKLFLNGEELKIVAKRPASISAIGNSGLAANVHSYAINLPLKSAVYSRVSASDDLGHAISIRAVELACEFKFD